MPTYKKLAVASLVIDDAYQRPLDERRVKRIVKEFRPDMLGVLEVSQHNGTCAVFDGQHRLAAARLVGLDAVPCLVHKGMSQEQEAELFYRLQRDRKPIHPVDAFKARCVGGDPTAMAIREIAKAAGFTISSHRRAKNISAVKVLERVYRRGVLTDVLDLLNLWDGDLGATDGAFIDGVSLLCEGYRHRMTAETRKKLQAASAVVLTRNALSRQARSGGSGHADSRAAYVLIELRKAADLQGPPRGVRHRRKAA